MTLADLFRQLSILIGLPAVLLAGGGAVLVVVARDWRLVLSGYAIVSVMLSLLLSQVIPVEWALLQTVVGGLVAVLLYLSAGQLRPFGSRGVPPELRWPRMASLTAFRLLAVSLGAVAFVVARENIKLPLIDPLLSDALLWLTLIGLIGLALHEEPLHAGLSLLIILGGSQLLLYTLTQQRTLVGLLQGGQVILGLAIAYLVLARGLAAEQASSITGEAGGGP
jgi:hypothetical protein